MHGVYKKQNKQPKREQQDEIKSNRQVKRIKTKKAIDKLYSSEE